MWPENDAHDWSSEMLMIGHWRNLSHSQHWPNWQKMTPLIGGLCLTVDFNQMWSKLCPLSEDFVMQQTSTKCGPKRAPCWRTLSHCGLQPDVVQTCARCWRPCHPADSDQMWSKHMPLGGGLHFAAEFDHIWINSILIIKKSQYQTNRSLSINQCGTETAISNYVAISPYGHGQIPKFWHLRPLKKTRFTRLTVLVPHVCTYVGCTRTAKQ